MGEQVGARNFMKIMKRVAEPDLQRQPERACTAKLLECSDTIRKGATPKRSEPGA